MERPDQLKDNACAPAVGSAETGMLIYVFFLRE